MSSPALNFDIRFSLKKRLWCLALTSLTFLFLLPIRAGMIFQEFTGYDISVDPYTLGRITRDMTRFFSSLDALTIVVFIIMGIAAGLVFTSGMHKRRQVDFYCSLPVDRGHIFTVNFLTGTICVIIPYIIFLLLTILVLTLMGLAAYIPFGTLLGYAGMNILFFLMIYSTTFLAGVICGNLVVSGLMAIFFQAAGPIAVALYHSGRDLFQPTWYNAISVNEALGFSSPAARYIHTYSQEQLLPIWEALVLAVITAAFILLAWFLFRRRRGEASGKALVFPKSKPFIKYPITVIATTGMALMFYHIGNANNGSGWLWFFIGLFLGGIIAAQTIEIIYHADFRAITKKLPQLGITMGAMVIFSIVMITDLFGFNTYLPDKEDVAAVEVGFGNVHYDSSFNAADHSSMNDPDSDYNRLRDIVSDTFTSSGVLEDEASIAAVISVADKIINGVPDRETVFTDYNYMYPTSTSTVIRYTLKNGSTRTREYGYNMSICLADIKQELITLYNDPVFRENNLALFDLDAANTRISEMDLYENSLEENYEDSKAELLLLQQDISDFLAVYEQELMAMDGDALANSMPIGQIEFRHFAQDPDILTAGKTPEEYKDITYTTDNVTFVYPVYPEFTQSIAMLEEMGICDAELWEIKTSNIISMGIYQVIDEGAMKNGETAQITLPEHLLGKVQVAATYDYELNEQLISEFTMAKDRKQIIEILEETYTANAFQMDFFHENIHNMQVLVEYDNPYSDDSYVDIRYFPML